MNMFWPNPWRRRAWTATMALSLAALASACAPATAADKAQQLLDRAYARHDGYDKANAACDYVKALKEMSEAMKLYAEGAKLFPDNSSFNLGLGIFHNIRGEYPQAVAAFTRERDIVQGFDGPKENRPNFLASSMLGQAYEHLFDYPKAIRFYKESLEHEGKRPEIDEAIARCERDQVKFRDLPKWLASIPAPDGTSVDVTYDASPRSYPGHEQVTYRLARKAGRVHVYVQVPMFYPGKEQNRPAVLQRLKKIMELVEDCFRRSGLELHVECRFVPNAKSLPESHGVTLWDHYKPDDQRMGDAKNWPVLSAQGLTLDADVAASTVAHEVGHMLGLGHPPYYPDNPFTDVMTAGHPWAPASSKRVFPDDVKSIAAPLSAPAECRDALGRAGVLASQRQFDKAAAVLAEACEKCPKDVALHLACANALFDRKDYAAAAKAYTKTLELRPKDYHVHYFRGVSLSRAGKYKDAIDDFTLIVRQQSGGLHAAAYWERANAWEKLGRKDKAKADRKKSEEAVTAPKPEKPGE